MTHHELLAKLVSLGEITKSQAAKMGRGIDKLKQSGAIGLYKFREDQLRERIRKAKRK